MLQHIRRNTSQAETLHHAGDDMSTNTLPEYLEAHEVEALISRAQGDNARLLFMLQWRAGLRVSEALALVRRDLDLETDRPTLRVRAGKGGKSRIVPVHPEMKDALALVLNYKYRRDGLLVPVSRSTAWRWVQEALLRAERDGISNRAVAVPIRCGTLTPATF